MVLIYYIESLKIEKPYNPDIKSYTIINSMDNTIIGKFSFLEYNWIKKRHIDETYCHLCAFSFNNMYITARDYFKIISFYNKSDFVKFNILF